MAFQIGLYGRNLIPSRCSTWSRTEYESNIRDQNPCVLVQNHCESLGMSRCFRRRCCCNYTLHNYLKIKHICRCLIRNYMSAKSYQRNALLGFDDGHDGVTDGRHGLAGGKKKSVGYGKDGTGSRYREGALGQVGALSVHGMSRKQTRSSAKDDGDRFGKPGKNGYRKGGDGIGRQGKGTDGKGKDGKGGAGKDGAGKGRDGKGKNSKHRDGKDGDDKDGTGKGGDGKSKVKKGQDNKSRVKKDKDGRKGKNGKGNGEEEDEKGKAGGGRSKSDKSGQRKSGNNGKKSGRNGEGCRKSPQKATRWGSKYGIGKLSCREDNIDDYLRAKMLEKDLCRCLSVCQRSPPDCFYPSNIQCCTPDYNTSWNAACLYPASYVYCQAPMQVCVGMPCY